MEGRGGARKPNTEERLLKKRWLGQSVDLRGGWWLGKKDGVVFLRGS